MHRINIVGRLGNDPELRTTGGGDPVVNFSLADTERWKNKSTGETDSRTEWFRCACFGRQAEIIAQYCKKGQNLAVEGKLRTSTYEKDGQTQYKTEVIVSNFELIAPREDATMPPSKPQSESAPDLAEDIPF